MGGRAAAVAITFVLAAPVAVALHGAHDAAASSQPVEATTTTTVEVPPATDTADDSIADRNETGLAARLVLVAVALAVGAVLLRRHIRAADLAAEREAERRRR